MTRKKPIVNDRFFGAAIVILFGFFRVVTMSFNPAAWYRQEAPQPTRRWEVVCSKRKLNPCQCRTMLTLFDVEMMTQEPDCDSAHKKLINALEDMQMDSQYPPES